MVQMPERVFRHGKLEPVKHHKHAPNRKFIYSPFSISTCVCYEALPPKPRIKTDIPAVFVIVKCKPSYCALCVYLILWRPFIVLFISNLQIHHRNNLIFDVPHNCYLIIAIVSVRPLFCDSSPNKIVSNVSFMCMSNACLAPLFVIRSFVIVVFAFIQPQPRLAKKNAHTTVFISCRSHFSELSNFSHQNFIFFA